MKTTLFEFGKKAKSPQFFENSLNGIDVSLAYILSIHQDVIQIDNQKNVSFFGQDFINIILETGQYV